jgi:hypothetical protein
VPEKVPSPVIPVSTALVPGPSRASKARCSGLEPYLGVESLTSKDAFYNRERSYVVSVTFKNVHSDWVDLSESGFMSSLIDDASNTVTAAYNSELLPSDWLRLESGHSVKLNFRFPAGAAKTLVAGSFSAIVRVRTSGSVFQSKLQCEGVSTN